MSVSGEDLQQAPPQQQEPAPFTAVQERILDEPEIKAARDAGKMTRLYKLLGKRRKNATAEQCDAIDDLLDDRRLFLDSNFSLRGIGTWYGIGTSLYGRKDYDPQTDTYIATVWFTILALPIWPIGQYVLSDEAGGYRVFGKVPVAGVPALWRKIVLVLLLAGAVSAGYGIYRWAAFADMHFVNGLDVPVTVQVSGTTVTVPPNGREQRAVGVGRRHVIVTTADGGVIDEHDIDIPRDHDALVYNVLGAAPLLTIEIVYSTPQFRPGHEPDVRTSPHCGQRFFIARRIKYVFTEPPREIKMPDRSHKTRHNYLMVAAGGWRSSAQWLSSKARHDDAAKLCRKVYQVQPHDVDALSEAAQYARRADGLAGAIRLLDEMRRRRDGDVSVHRQYQDYMYAADRADECRSLYRKRASENPDSPEAAYLLARVLPLAEAIPMLERLAVRFERDLDIPRGLAWGYFVTRRFDDALRVLSEALEREADAETADAEKARQLDDLHVQYLRVLAADAQADKALERLIRHIESDPNHLTGANAFFFGMLKQAAPDSAPGREADHYLKKLFAPADVSPAYRHWFTLFVEAKRPSASDLKQITDADLRKAFQIMGAAQESPNEALAICRKAKSPALWMMDQSTLFLLACEAGRRGDRREALRLSDHLTGQISELPAMRAYAATGEKRAGLQELDLTFKAVVQFIDARRERAAGRSDDALLRQARADDALQTIVTQALQKWPPPKRGGG